MDDKAAQSTTDRVAYRAPQLQVLDASESSGKYVTGTVEFTNVYSTFFSGPS